MNINLCVTQKSRDEAEKMKRYFSIGETAKAVRHYDRIGLVQSSKKDERTNYLCADCTEQDWEVHYMKMPKMVLFDYGQTLIAEQKFDGVKGTKAVLQYATRNKYHLSAEQVQEKANEINQEFGRFNPQKRHLFQIEIPNTMFTPYLYESQGIEIALSNSEIDTVFWNAAAPGAPTEGIEDFLEYLKNKGIRTGVISNISYAPSVVAERINRLLPENTFEFIITSSNFMFRKPNKRIFDLALEKAELQPDEVWYIGDQYECDVKGSLNAGLMPIWYIGAIDLPYTEDKNILTVTDWNKLRQRMEE